VKAKLQGGITDRSDNGNVEASLAGGMNLGERGHIMGSIEYYKANKVESYKDRDWYQNWGTVDVGGPTQPAVIARNVSSRLYTAGGLIVLPGSQLNMTQFLTGGTAAPFQNGSLVGTTRQVGGTTFYDDVISKEQDQTGQGSLFPDTERGSVFLHGDYDFNDNWNGYFQYLYGQNLVDYTSTGAHMETAAWRGTIYNDNAYLPASVRQIMIQEGRGGPTTGVPFFRYASKLDHARARGEQDNDLNSMTVGTKGNVGDVRINAYYQYGRSKSVYTAIDFPRLDRLYRSLDAVRNGAGQIVCRSTLTNPGNGCVPINLFGVNSASQAARAYVSGSAFANQTIKQDVAAATLRGSPFATAAGPVQVAMGYEHRREGLKQVVSPLSTITQDGGGARGFPASLIGVQGGYFLGNSTPANASYQVNEGFAEVQVPLVRDQAWAYSLEFNAAGRVTHYSTAGTVWTYKAGLDYAPVRDVRFRGTLSRDIRAPSLGELYLPQAQTIAAVLDRQNNNASVTATIQLPGNPNLRPEKSDTKTVGIVFTPTFLRGFSASVDYYDMKIKDAIGRLSNQLTVDQCAAGNAAVCSLITRNNGAISLISTPNLNLATLKTRGVDVEANYSFGLGEIFGTPSRASLRALASYVAKLETTTKGSAPVDRADQTPFQTTLSANFDIGRFSALIQERRVGPRQIDTTYSPSFIGRNRIGAVWYTDLNVNYRLGGALEGVEIFAAANNLFDRAPPTGNVTFGVGGAPTLVQFYDVVGLYVTGGVRFKF